MLALTPHKRKSDAVSSVLIRAQEESGLRIQSFGKWGCKIPSGSRVLVCRRGRCSCVRCARSRGPWEGICKCAGTDTERPTNGRLRRLAANPFQLKGLHRPLPRNKQQATSTSTITEYRASVYYRYCECERRKMGSDERRGQTRDATPGLFTELAARMRNLRRSEGSSWLAGWLRTEEEAGGGTSRNGRVDGHWCHIHDSPWTVEHHDQPGGLL